MNLPVLVGLVFLIAAVATGLVRRYALAKSLLDIPNARSSHLVPTPRGGGLAIVVAATVGFIWLAVAGILDVRQLTALMGAIAVAAVGFMDDRYRVSVRIRLCVHLAAAAWAVFWLGGLPPILLGGHMVELPYAGFPLAVIGVVWMLNLFNFMDGIDGIAASEAVFIGVVSLAVGTSSASSAVAMVFAAACCGFLLWNWPPAKIFMGDVGSGYLGFVIGVLTLMATWENPVSLFVWLIAAAVFMVDATVTMVRRFLRGERIYVAHRSHAYQWLSRRWGSHQRVLLGVILVNVLWALPCALFAALHPSMAIWIASLAITPLIIGAVVIGAGCREPNV